MTANFGDYYVRNPDELTVLLDIIRQRILQCYDIRITNRENNIIRIQWTKSE
jgi:hypothetical protein